MGYPGAGRVAVTGPTGPSQPRMAATSSRAASGTAWRPSDPLTHPPRSILIVMMSALGDAIQVLPVAGSLKRVFPHAHLTWVIQPGPYGLVADHPWVDEFILFHRGGRGKTPIGLVRGAQAIGRTVAEVRASGRGKPGGQFDLLLDLQVYFKAGIITALSPARIKLGFDRARARDLNHLFTTDKIPPHPSGCGHIQDQYFEFLHYLGVSPRPGEYGLRLSETEKEAQHRFFSHRADPVCAIVVATSDPRKNWTAAGYVDLIRSIRKELGLQPMLVGGRSIVEESMAREILSGAGDLVVDARRDDLRRLLWLLDGSALAISPDTGPLHLARAMGVPVVGLYGFTNPRRYGPYQRVRDWVVDGYGRYPGEPYPISTERRPDGMSRITAEMVMEKVRGIMETTQPTEPAESSGDEVQRGAAS